MVDPMHPSSDAFLPLFRQVVEQIAPAVVITDREGTILYVNPAFTRLTGYTLEEALGQNPRILKSGVHPQEFYAEMWNTILSKRPWRGDIVNRRKDGTLYWDHMTITPILDEQGEIVYFVAIKEDITLRKEMEESLKKAHQEALTAGRQKAFLLANVRHDLRTPLGGIVGYAEMLLSGSLGDLNDRQRQAVQRIWDSARFLRDFTDNLIHQAQLEREDFRFHPRTFAPQEMFRALPPYLTLAELKGIRLSPSVDPKLPQTLRGDPYWLERILANLINNAVKFTPTGGQVWVRLLAVDEAHWALQVEDTGPGITEEQRRRIFEPFWQAEPRLNHRERGLGLGLAIVKQLMERLNGEIRVESTPGVGTTFTLIFPYSTPDDPSRDGESHE